MSALELDPVPALGARVRFTLSDAVLFARRRLAHVRQIPEKLIDVTVQPLMFVLLFAFVFGGVIAVPGGNYREYLIGGILVQTLAFGMMGPASSMATDLGEGIVDRFRSLPTSRTAFLMGHLFAELAATCLGISILAATGFAVGWSVDSSPAEAIGGVALLLLFAIAMIWLGTLLGVLVRSTDSVMGVGFLVVFPLTFLSNAFVPVSGLPAGLQTIAEWNPISSVVAAVRTLFGNPTAIPDDAAWPLQHPVLSATVFCVLLLAAAVPATTWRFRVRTTD